MSERVNNSGRSLLFGVIVGILGGLALILTVTVTKRGPMVFVPYAAMLLAVIVYFRMQRVASFSRRFGTAFAAFMLSNLIGDLYVTTVPVPNAYSRPLLKILLPLAAMLVIGAAVSAVIAAATPVRRAAV
jgi:hypothetical protein